MQQLPEPEHEGKLSYGSTDEHIEYNDEEADVYAGTADLFKMFPFSVQLILKVQVVVF